MAEVPFPPTDEIGPVTNDESLLQRVKKNFKDADNASRSWRHEAKSEYDFVAGKQWSNEDITKMKEDQRPVITFNRVAPIIDAVAGAEVQNRQEVKYLPRTLDDTGVNDVLTEAARWVRDQCDAEDEESDAFTDCLICGMGWTETRMDYENDLDGEIRIERVDPFEMWWDPTASKRNLSDASWVIRAKRMDIEDVKAMWPEKADQVGAHGPWDKQGVGFNSDANEPDQYKYGEETEWDARDSRIRVVEYQWWEREAVYRVAVNGKIVEFDKTRYARIAEQFEQTGLNALKQTKRVYKRAFIAGDVVLERGLAPCDTAFTFKSITGKRDKNKNSWYGLVRPMKDPQLWANKFYSQILHIISTNAKGGILAEENAFENVQKAEHAWARADGIVYTKPGALARNAIQPKPTAPYPTGLDRLMELAMTAHYQTTGVNLEMLGMADRTQAGVLEYQRRQAGLTILATLFDSLRRYRKEQGRVLLYFIREYISDNRLVRVVGETGAKFVPLAQQDEAARYDVIVDEAATAPNMKERTFQVLVQILPALMKAGISIPKELLDFTPLPASLVEKWKQELAQQPQIPEEIQKEMETLRQENAALKQDQQIKLMELQADSKIKQAEFMQDAAKVDRELGMKEYKMLRELDIKEEKAEAEVEIARKRANAQPRR